MNYVQIERAYEWLRNGQEVALATVINTRGSSPQPVGGQLVVNDQEAFMGSVSGGCLESTIVTEAQFVIRSNRPKRLSIGIDIGDTWDYVLGCGGSIDIYIEPVKPWQKILKELIKRCELRHSCCLVTNLIDGAKALICTEMPYELNTLDMKIVSYAKDVIQAGQNQIVSTNTADYFLHRFVPQNEIIIGGAVHIAQILVAMAPLLGYQCTIIDPRTAYATEERFPNTKLLLEHPKNLLKHICLHRRNAVVALSHSPQFDDPLLSHAIEVGVDYIGALGSKKTHADRLARLEKAGFTADQLNQIHGPIGLDLGCKTPAEIALSIMAQIVYQKRNP